MTVQKGLNPVSYLAGGTIAIYSPVKMGVAANTVIATSAATDPVVGFAQLDASSGGNVPVEPAGSGATVKLRVGSGTVTGGDLVGLDGTDKTEIATLTEAGAGTTVRQVLGIVAASTGKTYAENTYAPVTLVSARTTI